MSDVYDRLRVKKIINAAGTVTVYCGALMPPQVLAAMAEAARHHVVLAELHEKAGKRIAELIGVEAAYVSAGAAAGLVLATAALIAGKDPVKMDRLPDTTGMKNEVILHKCQRMGYDPALRRTGAKLVEIGTAMRTQPWEMKTAINERTAFCFYAPGHNDDVALPFEVFRDIAKAHNLPILVDNAAEVPPASNLRLWTDLGADLVVVSGGKGIRGPQAAGLILGRKDLIEACAANGNPNHFIGRPMKVGKEEIVGMVTALELYLSDISQREQAIWEGMVAYILDQLRDVPRIRAWRHFPYRPTCQVPLVVVAFEDGFGLTCAEVMDKLNQGEPPIYCGSPVGYGYPRDRGLIINPHAMLEGQEVVVARRLREVFLRQ